MTDLMFNRLIKLSITLVIGLLGVIILQWLYLIKL